MNKSMKNIYYVLAGFMLFILFFSFNSCNKSTPTEPQNSSPPPASGTTSLGIISYSPDYSKEKSAELDTSAIDISTTDASGIKWDLHIPKQDFQSSTTITITPIINVKSDTTYNITNGVVFQPDGFQFTTPAILTVTFTQLSQKNAFYFFSQNGKNVEFASFSDSAGSYKIPITHFSGAATGTPHNLSEFCAIGTAKYNEALTEENNILQQTPVVPVPPDIDLNCGIDPSKEKILDDYLKQFMLPEDTVIKKMLGGLAAMQLAGCNPNITAGGMVQTGKLAEHLLQKAQMAYNQYSNDNKKYPAVVKAMLSVSAKFQLLGGTPPANELAQLGIWAKNYYDAQLLKFTQSHDYSVIHSLFTLSSEAQLFGVDAPYYNEIINAATFKLTINEGLENIIYDNGIPPDTQQVIIQGAIDLQPSITNAGFSYTGQGYINYIYGLTGDACYDAANNPQRGHDKIVLPQNFSFTVYVDSLNLCKQNYVSIRFDSVGSDFEQWNYGYDITGANGCTNVGSDMQHSANASLTLDMNNFVFSNESYFDYYSDGFNLRPFIHNNNINAVDTTYSVDSTLSSGLGTINLKGQLQIKLVHNPQ
jgi:hypothetical protein